MTFLFLMVWFQVILSCLGLSQIQHLSFYVNLYGTKSSVFYFSMVLWCASAISRRAAYFILYTTLLSTIISNYAANQGKTNTVSVIYMRMTLTVFVFLSS